MRRSLRFLLLAMGCVVMVATSPSVPPGTQFINLSIRLGTAETFFFEAFKVKGRVPLAPRVHLRAQTPASPEVTPVRLIGLLSPDAPTAAGYNRLDPRGTFTVGQQVEGLGTVAFVHEVPFDTRSSNGAENPWVLPEARGYYMTLLAQGGRVEMDMDLLSEDLHSECDCEVDNYYEFYESHFYFPEADPDAGTGGRDGG